MKLKSLIVCCLMALLTFIGTTTFAATVDIRFANSYIADANCAGSSATSFCFTVQIKESSNFGFEVGNATVFFTYNADAITNPVHTSLNFDVANSYGFDPQMSWLETAGAGTSGNTLGEVNYAILLSDGAGTGTPTVTNQTWIDVAQFCFDVVDDTKTTELEFVIVNPINATNDNYTGFNNDTNIRADSHTIGTAFALDTDLACPLQVPLRVVLEGAYTGSNMSTNLQSPSLSSGFAQPIIPFRQPYTNAPWNHVATPSAPAKGSEAIASLPANMVDWVLVEASTTNGLGGIIETRAGILMSNGDIMDPNVPSSFLMFYNLTLNSSYTFIVRHRNHLAIATPSPVTVQATTSLTDLTTSAGEFYYGFLQTKSIGGTYVMRAGDVNSNSEIDFIDRDVWANPYNPVTNPDGNGAAFEYLYTDIDMNGETDFLDRDMWSNPQNNGQLSPIDLFFP